VDDRDPTSVTTPVAPSDWDATSSIKPNDGYELVDGTSLGEYTIEGKIGAGGMGTVYSATHPVIGKRAAVKVLNKELCANADAVERFIDEARVVNQIQHPNIVDIFAFGETADGRAYFVMEWLKGETLRARIARGRLSPAEVCAVVRPLCLALHAVHEKNVIHRDLKPDNVFLAEVRDADPKVTLLDFGIAKLAHRDRRIEKTATGAMVGTPQYVAPEQAKGHAIDARVDIYALGAIAFEMLTGEPPFVADNAMEVVAKHLMEEPRRVSEVVRGVPKELDDLIFAMLAKQADARPSLDDITALIERLRQPRFSRALAKVPTLLPVPAQPRAVTAAPAKRRTLWLALGLGGAVACFAIAFAIVSNVGGAPDPAPHEIATPPPVASPAVPAPPAPPPPLPVQEAPAIAPEIELDKPKPAPIVVKHPPAVKRPKPKPQPAKLPDDDKGLIAPGSLGGYK
jgi:serine/threonine-protein kinase